MFSIRKKINYWLAPYVWKKKPAEELSILWSKTEKPFLNHQADVSEKIVHKFFDRDNEKYPHDEFIKKVSGKLHIDPSSGFLIDKDGSIITDSIVFDHHGAYPDGLFTRKGIITKLPQVILFDHYWSLNYFHFYSDVIGKLFLIEEKQPALKRLPLIISYKLSQSRQFKFFMQFPEVASFNWYTQKPDETIATEEAYLLQPMPYDYKYWQKVRTLVKPYLKPFDTEKKIFINRPARTGRYISNFEEIRPIIEAAGFQIEEMEDKTIEDQIALFSSAAVVAAVHGAAMVNLVYCDTRCKVLEVMPLSHINTHYYWLSTILGLAAYDCLVGDNLLKKRLFYPKGKFHLDPLKTKHYLEKICDQSSFDKKQNLHPQL